ncbi:zinc-binding dehydrogenase [Konateibacter massiliensis]|uniref:zinc-binding dehydrogenase n=1 Tax=Konateibacter massiliensis TaxID=2002841 RepID=UPI000C14B731|nr:zinc-binding dehydrogenase [Konateibacter massiliensis]
MKAVQLIRSCKAEEMEITEVPIPSVRDGWVLVKIIAFGLNHSELVLRKYEVNAPYIKKPIIPGIECAGVIEDPSDSRFEKGDKVIALMGGMGRSFNGSYAEYALLPISHVFRMRTKLDWVKAAAIPETFFTAYGSLIDCLQLKAEDTLLVHGGTSALGQAAIQLGKAMGSKVIATSRKEERLSYLKKIGADMAMMDDGTLEDQVKKEYPQGITKVLELIGPSAIEVTSKLLQKHGIICSTGQLGGSAYQSFDPIKALPNGVYLSSFYSNYPTQDIMDEIFSIIEEKCIEPEIGKILPFDEIKKAHELLENGEAGGKIVISVNSHKDL